MDKVKNDGSILLIAIMVISFLGGIALAVLGPVSTSAERTDYLVLRKKAQAAADSVAERIKYYMTQDGAVAQDGTSQAVLDAIAAGDWAPVSLADNGGVDKEGVTFPTIDMVDGSGNPVFNTAVNDLHFPAFNNESIRYIAYTTEDPAGSAASYVSAEVDGEVINIRVSYRRMLASELPHESYLHAIYAANYNNSSFTFKLEGHGMAQTISLSDRDLRANGSISSNGCLNVKADESKGWLGFPIPNIELQPGDQPKLKIYVQNVPGQGNVTINLHDAGGELGNGFVPKDQLGNPIGQITVNGSEVKHEYIEFPLDAEIFNQHKGDNLYVAFSVESVEGSNGNNNGGNNSELHLKVKDGTPPMLTYAVDAGQDEVQGDIFINGNADVSEGFVDGTTKATGEVTGDGTGDEVSESDNIPAPDLAKDGEWYQKLALSDDGTASSNPVVVTDSSDGSVDGKIAGIICPFDQTGENQPYMDDDATSDTVYVIDSNFGVEARGPGRHTSGDPTYDSGTDSVIVTVPDEYNNKAVFVPGDFWFDILDPTFIDLRTASGKPARLTFIVEGNVYLTDGVNRGVHPDSVDGGAISVISLKNRDGNGGNIYYGDPSAGAGRIDPIKAYLYAENNFGWYPKAENAGDFDLIGNMTAGNQIDFSKRGDGGNFVPVNIEFDPSILDPEVRDSLPMLPPPNTNEIIPGSPYKVGSYQVLE